MNSGIWTGVAITIDTWPFLRPFVEVEGPSEQVVREGCRRLSLPYQDALVCSIDVMYARQYGISPDVIKRQVPALTFAGENPLLRFVANQKEAENSSASVLYCVGRMPGERHFFR